MSLPRLERSMLIGSIVSAEYLQKIQPHFRIELLQSPFTQIVAQWAWDYYNEYSRPINRKIIEVVENETNNLSPEIAETCIQFLDSISKEYENTIFDWESLYDDSIRFFKRQSMAALVQTVSELIDQDELDEAQTELDKYKEISKPQDYGESLFTDTAYDFISDSDDEILFKYRGTVGKLLNQQFVRGGFITFIAPPKRGKSFILDDLAIKAYLSRKNVALFECGDTPRRQRIRRIWGNLCGVPIKKAYCGEVIMPVLDCAHNQNNSCREFCRKGDCGVIIDESDGQSLRELFTEMKDNYVPCTVCLYHDNPELRKKYKGAYWYEDVHYETPLCADLINEKKERLKKRVGKKDLKLSFHPAKTLTVKGIKSILSYWKATEGFVPDVLVIDYADLLRSEVNRNEERDNVNDVWVHLRALAQEEDILVITATQGNRGSIKKDTIEGEDVSEDIRKLQHVTAAYGLNQTTKEKHDQIMRISPMLIREGECHEDKPARILQCLAITKPIVESF